ncbi:MAG: helicase-related protein [Candidatus Bathyarchaeota archaeon]|nr:helicase-related protein [Candidatus Bathyarchaeota archaeon]
MIYQKISELTKKLSGRRELGKANHLLKLSSKHKKSLAFDSSIITLSYLKHLINDKNSKVKVLVATGSNKIESEEVLKKFNLKSLNQEKIIALCSDKMAEGVDLQLASCLTLLDLPSVIRIVEQRFGRIDRMDTSHDQIDLYWPDDSEAFSLKGDRRLISLNQLVTKMWGSNFQAPSSLKQKHFSQLDSGIKGIIEEFNQFIDKDDTWEGIKDSFQPVLDLKNEKNGLITEQQYSQYRKTETSVKTKVSFLKSSNEWCFIAIRGNELRSPKWFFINSKEGKNEIFTEFSAICANLRMNISDKSVKAKWNDKYLAEYLKVFKENEINLLPPKKKRALAVASTILKKKSKYKSLDIKLKDKISDLLKLFETDQNTVDYEVFSELWIDLLQPYLDSKRLRSRSTKNVYNLNSLTTPTEIKKINFSNTDLEKILVDVPIYERIDHRIAACIVGVPYNSSS